MLVSNHGMGKSEVLTNFFQERGMKVVVFFASQMSDVGDLIGLPRKDEATGRTVFMPPYWWPKDGEPVVLFLDELSRARQEILQAVMDLALNRRLAGRPLPEGSRLVAAINYGDNYQTTPLDPAFVSRFNIYNFCPTVQEWLLWAKKVGVDHRVTDFIEENPMWLDKDPDMREGADTGIDKTPDRRAWKKVSDVIKGRDELGGVLIKIISSIVGPKAASAFLSSVAAMKMVSGRDVLMDFSKTKEKLEGYQLHQISVVNDGIFRHLEVEKVPDANKQNVRENLENYFEWLTKNKKEAAAHFTNLYVQNIYPTAVAFIARECRILTMCMITYVKGIK